MFADTRTEWRILDAERKAQQAYDQIHKVDSLSSDVGRLEHSCREIGSVVDGLRSELQSSREEVQRLTERLNEIDTAIKAEKGQV